jgi:hypothetical protein
VCFRGLVDGAACGFAFTPTSSGFFRISILTPSQTAQGLVDIQGSPFRVHVDDGDLFLPGVSVGGYLGFFIVSVLGGAVLVSGLFSVAWGHFKSSQPVSEYQEEMARLQHLATTLDITAQRRDDNEYLLKQLPLLMQVPNPKP